MKKIFAAITAAALMGFGLVATGGTASAACPYSACVKTSSDVKAPSSSRAGKNIKIKFKVLAAGNVKPTGKVVFTVKRKGGGFVLKNSKVYNGGTLVYFTSKLVKKGKYTVKGKFVPNPNSVFLGSSDSTSVRVK